MQAIRSETVNNIKRSNQCNIGTLLLCDDNDNNDNNNNNNNKNKNNNNSNNSQWTRYCKSDE